MAKSMTMSLSEAMSQKTGIMAAANRQIGGRTVAPGEYTFASDPSFRATEATRRPDSTAEPFVSAELCTVDGKWVSLNALLRRTLDEKGELLVYVNDWVSQCPEIFDLAKLLAGKKLIVNNDEVPFYSSYSREGTPLEDGQVRKVGSCYRASVPVEAKASNKPANA